MKLKMLISKWALGFYLLFLLLMQADASAQYNHIVRASQTSAGTASDAAPLSVVLSADESYLAFSSAATNLVNADQNESVDIFLYKRSDATLTLISRATNGNPANADSSDPAISSDGAYVAFASAASDLVANDTNSFADIFVYDRAGNSITRVSVSSSTAQANADSYTPSISADGRYVVFVSDATNLVSDDTNGKSDVFLHDRNTASTTRISVSTSLIQANGDSSSPVISGDATHIAYVSEATNLVSSDGNSATDVFLYNLSSAATTRVSLQTNGLEPNGSSYEPFLNSDASFLVYTSDATNIVSNDSNALSDVFLYNLSTAATERVSLSSSGLNPDGASSAPRVSTSGRHVSFTSAATNLVNGDTNEALDVFVRDRTDALTSRVSVSSSGQQANAASSNAVINADAQYLAFISAATNLLSADTNSVSDVFLTNIECLVDLGSSPSTDTDGDSTLNCNEDCGNDSSKTSPGTCGCGVADTDTDADSSADCDDECDSDASKSEVGRCGCGVSDADSNGNSVADCLDPTSSTVPRRGSVLRRSSRITVIFPGDFTGVTYRVTLRGPSGTITRSTRRVRLRISNLRSGVYKLTYTVTLGSITSLSSSRLRFRLR